MADLTRSEAQRLLDALRQKRSDAIDAGDLDELARVDDKIAELEASIEAAETEMSVNDRTHATGDGPDPEAKTRNRNIVLALLAVFVACGICGSCGDDEPPASANLSPPTRSVPVAEPEAPSPTIGEQVAEAEAALDEFDPAEWDDSEIKMAGAVGMFAAYADLVERADGVNGADGTALRQKLVAAQRRAFPRFRDAYGPIARRKVWEDDMDVRTTGSGFRTAQFTAGLFAANRNIAEFQRGVTETLRTLRFQRTEYRWYRDASEFTYYDLESPSDSDLVGTSEL